jgi:hypothetical protein
MVAIADRVDLDPDVGRVVPAQPGPLGVVMAFAEALQRRDPRAAHAELEPGARVLTAEHTEVSDPEAVGIVLAQLTSPERRLDICPGRTIVKDDAALCTQSWRLRSVSGDPGFERGSCVFFLLRRAGERWRIAIAAPWG